MKCQSCKAEFAPPAGSSLSNCPFCGKPLVKPAPQKNKTFAETLGLIAVEQGENVLQDERLMRLFTDYMPAGKGELHFLRSAFECGVPQKLAAACGKPGEEQQIVMARCVKQLVDINIAEKIAEDYLWVLAGAMGWAGRPQQEDQVPAPQPAGSANIEEVYQQGERLWEMQDYKNAVSCFAEGARLGHAPSQNRLASAYSGGRGVAADNAEAFVWRKKAAEQGYALAQRVLGYAYEKGDGVTKDETKAFYWYQKAAEQGDADGQWHLGNAYEKGRGVARDDAKALYWYQKAAEQGNVLGQLSVAEAYLYGRGTAPDTQKAKYWEQKAYDNTKRRQSTDTALRKLWWQ